MIHNPRFEYEIDGNDMRVTCRAESDEGETFAVAARVVGASRAPLNDVRLAQARTLTELCLRETLA